MKKTYLLLCLSFVFGISVRTLAQTDPGTANLTHQWTFDDGTAKDNVGDADGTLMGGAIIANKALNTLGNGYLQLPAAKIGINAYSAVSLEIWFTSGNGLNTGWTIFSYFGNTVSGSGADYLFMTTARADNVSMAAIQNTTASASVNDVSGTEYDDGKLHHMVETVDATNISFFIDGVNVGTTALTTGNSLANVSTAEAYLARSGWGDPYWLGNIHKYSIYNKVLSSDEVLYLFQQGPEKDAVISATVSSLAFDSNYPAQVFNVSGTNLTSDITVTAPTGLLILDASGNSLTSIKANTSDVALTAIYDGSAVVDGNITLTSGSTVVTIPVKSADDVACFVPLYSEDISTDLNADPGLNSLATYGGWGTRTVETIITDPADVYCGASSIEVGDGVSTGTGSLDMPISTLLLPNTIYRVKAMVKTVDGSFQIGLSGTDPAVITSINTNNEWKAIDFTFTTGATLSTPGMYFNNYTCTGKTAFIDNWELYVAKNPIIKTSTTSYIADNNLGKTFKFTSLAANLKDNITITAPAGITVSPATISKDSITQQTITATYDGTTAIDGNIVLTSDTVVVKVAVISDNNSSSACFTPLYTDRTNIVPDPYMNNTTAGWGTHELILAKDYPDSVYCGLSCGRISGSGDFDIALTGKIKPNTSYVAKAMVMTFGQFQLGVFGVDSVNTADIVDTFSTHGVWQPVIFNFTTGVGFKTGGTQGLYFNNWQLAGTRAFIDNWELYEAGPSAVQKVSALTSTVYVSDGKIVAKFELADASLVKFDVYDIRGELIATDQMQGIAGSNYRVLKATVQSGVYLVKMTQNGQSSITKLVK